MERLEEKTYGTRTDPPTPYRALETPYEKLDLHERAQHNKKLRFRTYR